MSGLVEEVGPLHLHHQNELCWGEEVSSAGVLVARCCGVATRHESRNHFKLLWFHWTILTVRSHTTVEHMKLPLRVCSHCSVSATVIPTTSINAAPTCCSPWTMPTFNNLVRPSYSEHRWLWQLLKPYGLKPGRANTPSYSELLWLHLVSLRF